MKNNISALTHPATVNGRIGQVCACENLNPWIHFVDILGDVLLSNVFIPRFWMKYLNKHSSLEKKTLVSFFSRKHDPLGLPKRRGHTYNRTTTTTTTDAFSWEQNYLCKIKNNDYETASLLTIQTHNIDIYIYIYPTVDMGKRFGAPYISHTRMVGS